MCLNSILISLRATNIHFSFMSSYHSLITTKQSIMHPLSRTNREGGVCCPDGACTGCSSGSWRKATCTLLPVATGKAECAVRMQPWEAGGWKWEIAGIRRCLFVSLELGCEAGDRPEAQPFHFTFHGARLRHRKHRSGVRGGRVSGALLFPC
jgi:hypothetical protein